MSKPKQQLLVNVCSLCFCHRHFINITYIRLISAKNEAKHAVSIQEVTSLADSFDSPLICADLRVSSRSQP